MIKTKKKLSNGVKPSCCKNNSNKKIKRAIDFLKIISEENRLKILCILKEKEKCVCEIWKHLELPQNLISHHLKVLKDFNLISSRKQGIKVFYKLNQRVLIEYVKLLNKFLNL
ncbi:metalloregulator ArsR/SmtB family transcription factor [Patescibacteria group bacterium]|nr:metalloregulator ArsR/SmtB family transcription factor [Patescibacteria group bacterium]